MERKFNCPACNAIRHGVKSRIALDHVDGCEFNKHSIPLQNVPGHATFTGNPSKELIEAVNKMAELAYNKKNLKSTPRQQ